MAHFWDKMHLVWMVYYTHQQIPETVLTQRPLILDPSNPWHNVVSGISDEISEEIKTEAKASLAMLDDSSATMSGLLTRPSKAKGA